jgi:hypothetical protein
MAVTLMPVAGPANNASRVSRLNRLSARDDGRLALEVGLGDRHFKLGADDALVVQMDMP